MSDLEKSLDRNWELRGLLFKESELKMIWKEKYQTERMKVKELEKKINELKRGKSGK